MDHTVVIDNGTYTIQPGIAGQNIPKQCLYPVVGKSKAKKDATPLIGTELYTNHLQYTITHPIEHGFIADFEAMISVWQRCFKITSNTSKSCLITQESLNSKLNRANISTIMFEHFGMEHLAIKAGSQLSIFQTGCVTGLALDMGHGLLKVSALESGQKIQNAQYRNLLAGYKIDDHLRKLLEEVMPPQNIYSMVLKNIKEKYCYVSQNFTEETEHFQPIKYEMPDGKVVYLAEQLIKAPEAFFQPQLVCLNSLPIHQIIQNSIRKCKAQLTETLHNNIILTGGMSMFSGLPQRLKSAIESKCIINASQNRAYCSWVGGSILASLSTFGQICISKSQYEEFGANITLRFK